MTDQANITPELCRQLLDYDAESGRLFWRKRPPEMFVDTGTGGNRANAARWNGQYAGREALCAACRPDKNRRSGTLLGRKVYAHRVAWAIVYGEWPTHSIDHIDGDAGNNRIENLRDVSHGENMLNKWKAANNASGVNGVSWNKNRKKWEAYTKIGGKRCSLGHWKTIEEAQAARYAADRLLGFSKRHGQTLTTPK